MLHCDDYVTQFNVYTKYPQLSTWDFSKVDCFVRIMQDSTDDQLGLLLSPYELIEQCEKFLVDNRVYWSSESDRLLIGLSCIRRRLDSTMRV